MENQQSVSPSRQCSSTPVGFGQGFPINEQSATLEQPHYSPDLPSADFYLFPRLRSALKGPYLCDGTDVIKNATEELKRLLQMVFENVSIIFTVADRIAYLHKGINLKEI